MAELAKSAYNLPCPEPLASIFEAAGVGAPVREHRFHQERKWRWDFAWPGEKIALEIHGGIWQSGRHSRGKGQLADWEKMNMGQLMGWIVLQAGTAQLANGAVVALVQSAFTARSLNRL